MVNWYGIRINAEDVWLSTFVLDPGDTAARTFGMEKASFTIDDSVDGMFQVLTMATKEKYGGKIVLYTGEIKA